MEDDKQPLPDWIDIYILPAHWASALVNDDRSGLDEEDNLILNEWLVEADPGYCIQMGEELGFSKFNDAKTRLACNVAEFYFDNRKNQFEENAKN